MAIDKKKALIAGATAGAIEVVKLIPFVGAPIEAVRSYHDSIEEQQREDFVVALSGRLDRLEQNKDWYLNPESEIFVKKTVATALNAEYADKLEFLVNAIVNGPSLGSDHARCLKFVEMIRHLSKPALEVMIAARTHRTGTGEVLAGTLADHLGWKPALVDACVREIHAFGGFSSVVTWLSSSEGTRPSQSFSGGQPAVTAFTDEFAEFISLNKGE